MNTSEKMSNIAHHARLIACRQAEAAKVRRERDQEIKGLRNMSANAQRRVRMMLFSLEPEERQEAARMVRAALVEGRCDTGDLATNFTDAVEESLGEDIHPCPWEHDKVWED